MIELTKDTHSLTDFKRKTSSLVKRMKKTGQPLVLTVNGKAELIVQDSKAYQQLLDSTERKEAIEGIRKGLDDVEKGRSQPAQEALEEIRRKHRIPRNR